MNANDNRDPHCGSMYVYDEEEPKTPMQEYLDTWEQRAQTERDNYLVQHDGMIFRTSIRVHVYDINSHNLIDTIRKTEYMNMGELMDLLDEIPDGMEEIRVGTQNKFKMKHKGPDNPWSDWWDDNIELNNDEEERFNFDMRIVATQSN